MKNAKKIKEGLIEKFPSVYQFCNGDLNKFVLLWRKGVYPYECMDSWEKFDETSWPPKEDFYSELDLEGISDEDYAHSQKNGKYSKQIIVVNIMTYMFKVIHCCLQMYLKILEI